jgi:hypothetical protein
MHKTSDTTSLTALIGTLIATNAAIALAVFQYGLSG